VILNLRGTNGSGKSTVAHDLLKHTNAEPLEFWPKARRPKPKAYGGTYKGVPIAILGSYETVCGGMDTITDINDAADLIVKYGTDPAWPIVFYEGLFISHCLGTVAKRIDEAGLRSRLHMAYLDTPLAVSLERVHKRRAERGITTSFKEQNVVDDFQRVNEWNFAKAEREGWNAYYIDHTNAIKEVRKILDKGVKAVRP
jgi:hypothetical protein